MDFGTIVAVCVVVDAGGVVDVRFLVAAVHQGQKFKVEERVAVIRQAMHPTWEITRVKKSNVNGIRKWAV